MYSEGKGSADDNIYYRLMHANQISSEDLVRFNRMVTFDQAERDQNKRARHVGCLVDFKQRRGGGGGRSGRDGVGGRGGERWG